MKESGPTTRRRAAIAIAALLGVLFALLPATPANAAPAITVGYPSKTGLTWTLGTSQQVTWSTGGGVTGSVKIQLYQGGVAGAVIKAATPASAGAFTWTIPVNNATGSNFKVRVMTPDGVVFGQSTNNFSIQPPTPTVISPNGGENFILGTRRAISWDLAVPGAVLVQLNDGSAVKTLKTVPAAAGAFSWDIPLTQATGTTFTIIVKSVSNPGIFDASDAPFTIAKPTVTVSSPISETWVAGTRHDIVWSAPFPGNVRVELTGGSVPIAIKASTLAKAGRFTWDIPLNIATGTTFRVKVTSTDNLAVSGLSAASLTITTPTVGTVLPSGGTVTGGTKEVISWVPGQVNGNVRLDLIGGPTPLLIKASVPSAVGQFTWDVPLTLSTAVAYKIKVTSVSQPSITTSSASTFALSQPLPSVNFPGNGDTWVAGTTRQISWSFAGPGNVSINLLKGGVFVSSIKASVPASDDVFNWAIPLSLAAGNNYSIEIKSLVNKALSTTGPVGFVIALPSLTANNPGTLIAGTTESLSWTPIAGTVRLAYTTDNVTFTTIKAAVPGTVASFSWDVPIGLATGTTYRILVASTANPTGLKSVTSTFQLDAPVLTLQTPTNAAVISKAAVSGVQLIEWTSTAGLLGNVKIELIQGSTVKVVKASTPVASGSFNWAIGSQATGAYTLKISMVGRPATSSSINITLTA